MPSAFLFSLRSAKVPISSALQMHSGSLGKKVARTYLTSLQLLPQTVRQISESSSFCFFQPCGSFPLLVYLVTVAVTR